MNMAMGSVSDDEISLTSTVGSEQQSEYDVEAILGESQFDDGTRYLVQWTGYPIERSSWEPAECLDCSETLLDWEKTKQRISEGKEYPFDIDAYEARVRQLDAERAERKRRRLDKRQRIAAFEASRSSKLVKLPIERESSHQLSKAPASRPPGPRPRSLYQDPGHTAGQGLSRPPVPKAPPAVTFGTDQAAPKKVHHTDEPKFPKNLSTKWKYEKLGKRERTPNLNQLDLRRPSEWNSMPSASAVKPGVLRLISDDNGNRPMADNLSSVSSSPRLLNTFQMSPLVSPMSNISPRNMSSLERKETTNTPRDYFAADDPFKPSSGELNIQNPPRAPRIYSAAENSHRQSASDFSLQVPSRIPGRNHMKVNNHRWWNRGEYYVTMYFGPEKYEIGNARLCGIGYREATGIFKKKIGREIEIWFENLCSFNEYQELCKGMKNNKISNGWIEGFDDNEPEIRGAAERLWHRGQVAIARINDFEFLLAYPPRSPQFSFLDDNPHAPEQGYLNLTLRGPLGSIDRLKSRTKQTSRYRPLAEVNNTVESGHSELSQVKPSSVAQPLRGFDVAQENIGQSSAFSSTPDNSSTANHAPSHHVYSPRTQIQPENSIEHQESPPSADPMDLDPRPSRIQSEKPMIRPKSVSFADTMDLDVRATETAGKSIAHQDSTLVAGHMDLDARPTEATIPENVVPKPHTAPTLDEHFSARYGITFEKLATITGTQKPKRAEMFYVWFPEEFRDEREWVMKFLKQHTPQAALYSNSDETDWDRFIFTVNKNIIHGAVLFHGSFVDYHKVPSLRDTLHRTKANFWNVSLIKPLNHVDPPLHLQQLFPHGGVFLLTEDFMLRDADSTMIILEWFYEGSRKKTNKPWKIMLRPNILTWLIKQMNHADKLGSQWLAIYQILVKLGCDPENDLLRSLDDDPNSNLIISPSLSKYGSRTPDDSPDIPRDCTQEQRNADHLAEYFAGWSLLNAHRFRKFVILSLHSLDRWKSWQHIEVKHGARAFFENQAINYRKIHSKLTKDPAKLSSSNDPSGSSAHASEPFTPRTPTAAGAAPSSSSSSESRPALAAHQPLSTRIYAQPYQ
ncbi:putative Chromo domain protein Chp1p [Aspergillus undulatus]|uniref:putative Chromo domain protein Chp1p n=1 Tax=Aspergillus undulatus TaxID=1810928 RepID=UPI003CCD5A14